MERERKRDKRRERETNEERERLREKTEKKGLFSKIREKIDRIIFVTSKVCASKLWFGKGKGERLDNFYFLSLSFLSLPSLSFSERKVLYLKLLWLERKVETGDDGHL